MFFFKNSLFFNFVNLDYNKFNDLKIYIDFNKIYNNSFFYNFFKENKDLFYIINLNEKNILKHRIFSIKSGDDSSNSQYKNSKSYLDFFDWYNFIFNNIQRKNFLIKKNHINYFLSNYLINYEIKINKKFNYNINYEKIIKNNYFSKNFLLNKNYYWKNLINSIAEKETSINYYKKNKIKENIFNSNKRIYYYMKFFFLIKIIFILKNLIDIFIFFYEITVLYLNFLILILIYFIILIFP